MIQPQWGILVVCAVLATMFVALKLLERFARPHPELPRKLMHVGMGLAVISFPWVFAQNWPVLLLGGLSAVLLACLKTVPRLRDGVGTILTGVHEATRVGVMEAQSTATNGALARLLRRWIIRATISLPVPVSPSITTVASVPATRATVL